MRKFLIAFVLAMVIVGLIALRPPMAPTASSVTPPYFGGDWDIGGIGECTNEVLVVNGNVMVDADSSLTLTNCTLYIDGTVAGEYEFNSSVDLDGAGPSLGGIVYVINSTISPGPTNPSANFRFKMLGDTFHLNGSTVIGAGIDSAELFDTGVYVNTSTQPLIFNSVIKNGYSGLVLAQLPTSVGATVKNLTSASNSMFGVLASQSHNVSILDSNISYNVATGINISQGGNVTINNTFVWKNGGRGISHEPGISFAKTYPYIMFNDIRNNTDLAIFHTFTLTPNPTIQGNTMCWNGGSIVFNTGGTTPMYNFFCININSPSNNAFVRSGTVFSYTVGNNPTGQMAIAGGGNTSCTVSFNMTNQSYAYAKLNASAPEIRNFINNTLSDGIYAMSVFCDPYNNIAQSDTVLFIKDTKAPGWSFLSGGQGRCAEVNLSVRWQDATTNVSWVWLSTNETGSFLNYSGTYGSPKYLNNQSGWTNFTWWNENLRGKVVAWQVWGNDSAGNENATPISNFTAIPCSNPAPLTGGICGNITLAVQWLGGAYNLSTVFLATNETGAFANYTNYPAYSSPQNVSQGANWTNFTWWNISMSNKLIGWQAYFNDTFGTWNLTNVTTFIAAPCAAPSVTPAVAGGGAEGQGVQTCAVSALPGGGSQFVFQPAAVNGLAACSAEGVVRYLSIRFAGFTNLPTVLTAAEVDAPVDIPPPSLATYAWMNITKTLPDSAIGKTTIRFAVSTTWLTENAINPASVMLYRWNVGRGTWAPITPTIVSTGNVTLYEAELPGFSLFAIGGPQACPQCPEPSDYSECVDGRHSRTEYACSEGTGFVCKNLTATRDCVCPDCPRPSVTDCTGGKRTRTTYSCSADTNFDCAASEKVESCGLPRLLPFLNLNQLPEEERPLVDVAIIGGSVALVGAVWYFLTRPHPRRR